MKKKKNKRVLIFFHILQFFFINNNNNNYNMIILYIGDWGLGPIQNPKSPIPNYNYFIFIKNKINIIVKINLIYIKL